MKNKNVLITLTVLLITILSCSGTEDFNPGIGITTCDHKCGEYSTCQTSRGDMEKKEKQELSFPFGGVTEQGARDYPESMKTVNATITVTVEGEGTVKVTVENAGGKTTTVNATKGIPAVITDTFKLRFEKEKPGGLSDNIESAHIEGIRVETVNGPAVGVQVNMTINECTDNWCTRSHPNCSAK
jgi:hypothetical protein